MKKYMSTIITGIVMALLVAVTAVAVQRLDGNGSHDTVDVTSDNAETDSLGPVLAANDIQEDNSYADKPVQEDMIENFTEIHTELILPDPLPMDTISSEPATEAESVLPPTEEWHEIKHVYVGDSRFVGMKKITTGKDVFICKNSMGYDYLVEQMDNIRNSCDKYTVLVVGLGINDMGMHVSDYINKLNEMVNSMDATIYYMLVNPVDELKEKESGYGITNAAIDEFNVKMMNGLDKRINIIDANTYLKENGFDTGDGIHYTPDTYRKLYSYIESIIP